MMSTQHILSSPCATSVQSFTSSIRPSRRLVVVTCMDARIDPSKILGLQEGECHVIRNAGGRVMDALRSIVISQELMDTREVVIMHHTECGACTLDESYLKHRLSMRKLHPVDASSMDFMAFKSIDPFENVKREIEIYRQQPLLLQSINILGYVYNVHTKVLTLVE